MLNGILKAQNVGEIFYEPKKFSPQIPKWTFLSLYKNNMSRGKYLVRP